jgi:peptidoglycan/LPS O-acetylase OafA/YrhL
LLGRDVVFAVATAASLAAAWSSAAPKLGAWCAIYFYMFALGVWTRWALDGRAARGWLALLLALTVGRSIQLWHPGPALCASTAMLLLAAARWQRVARFIGRPWLVHLGVISYSFYLLHALVGGAVLTPMLEGIPGSIARDCVGLALAVVVSLVSAQLLYSAVERPAMALSRRVKLASGPQPVN